MRIVRQTLSTITLMLIVFVASFTPAQAIPQLLIDMRTNEVLYQNQAGAPDVRRQGLAAMCR